MNDEERFNQGLATRKSVLGEAYVRKAIESATELRAEFQNFITRYAFGEIWSRPGLPRETRRLMVLTSLIALNRSAEFKLHARAAMTEGGISVDQIKEVILQSAIYAGVPAANTAFHDLADVLAELESTK